MSEEERSGSSPSTDQLFYSIAPEDVQTAGVAHCLEAIRTDERIIRESIDYFFGKMRGMIPGGHEWRKVKSYYNMLLLELAEIHRCEERILLQSVRATLQV